MIKSQMLTIYNMR